MQIPLISIIGKSGTGKTTLLEKIIKEIKSRGYRLATIKHHSHRGFEIDHPGKDSFRHGQAGSDIVIISSPDKLAIMEKLKSELSLDDVASKIVNVDIILTEGYKSAGKPSLEIIRQDISSEPMGDREQLIGIITDFQLNLGIPRFEIDDISGIVGFIEDSFLK